MKTSAVISACESYRYVLKREWDAALPVCGFIMLNPSTADANVDDPTIRRCIGFAKREGCGSLIVMNLFAFRATDPKILKTVDNVRGTKNQFYLGEISRLVNGPLIAAWGAHPLAIDQGKFVANMIGSRLKCLGKTNDGHPRHPLYVKGDAELIDFMDKGASHVTS